MFVGPPQAYFMTYIWSEHGQGYIVDLFCKRGLLYLHLVVHHGGIPQQFSVINILTLRLREERSERRYRKVVKF